MNRRAGLVPARIGRAADGTPRAADYDDVYHSASGAAGQARHVFLGGNRIVDRWAGREQFAILETGFGLGTNFLVTWRAWRDDPRRPRRLHYVALEKHPPGRDDLAAFALADPDLAPLAEQLRDTWPPPLAGFHRLHFENDAVTLTLCLGDARQTLPQVTGRFDAFYLDGFAPEHNPELWSAELMADLAALAAPAATCATYTVARTVRDALATAGFDCRKQPGYGGKRDMLAGTISANAVPPIPLSHPLSREGREVLATSLSRSGRGNEGEGLPTFPATGTAAHVAVVGAGIAGVAVAERLASRGFRVTLLEAREAPAQGATGNRLAVMLPVLALDETRLARCNRAAYLYALHRLQRLAEGGYPARWSGCGVLQLPRSEDLAIRQRRIIDEQALPPGFAALLDRDAATALAGAPLASGGWWFPQGGWIDPGSLCRALLAAGGANIALRCQTTVTRLDSIHGRWRLIGDDGVALIDADAVVLAHAHGLRQLEQSAHLPLRCFRGQVSHLPAQRNEPPDVVVCGDGYLTPPVGGWRSLGATFERGTAAEVRAEDHQANLRRLDSMLPGTSAGIDTTTLGARVGLRPVSPDKLPMLGALPRATADDTPPAHELWPRWPGLYVASGYGARGLVWAHLMAELLACRLSGEPLPLEADLAAAVDPARFAWKGHV